MPDYCQKVLTFRLGLKKTKESDTAEKDHGRPISDTPQQSLFSVAKEERDTLSTKCADDVDPGTPKPGYNPNCKDSEGDKELLGPAPVEKTTKCERRTTGKRKTDLLKGVVQPSKLLKSLEYVETYHSKSNDSTASIVSEVDEKYINPNVSASQASSELKAMNHLYESLRRSQKAGLSNVTCHECGENFINLQKARWHWKTVHSAHKQYACHLCLEEFYYLAHLRKHLILHFKRGNDQRREVPARKKNTEVVTKYGHTPVDCPSKDTQLKVTHLSRETGKGRSISKQWITSMVAGQKATRKTEECPMCQKRFSNVDGLNRHLKNHIETNSVEHKTGSQARTHSNNTVTLMGGISDDDITNSGNTNRKNKIHHIDDEINHADDKLTVTPGSKMPDSEHESLVIGDHTCHVSDITASGMSSELKQQEQKTVYCLESPASHALHGTVKVSKLPQSAPTKIAQVSPSLDTSSSRIKKSNCYLSELKDCQIPEITSSTESEKHGEIQKPVPLKLLSSHSKVATERHTRHQLSCSQMVKGKGLRYKYRYMRWLGSNLVAKTGWTNKTFYSCPICQRKFLYEANMKIHAECHEFDGSACLKGSQQVEDIIAKSDMAPNKHVNESGTLKQSYNSVNMELSSVNNKKESDGQQIPKITDMVGLVQHNLHPEQLERQEAVYMALEVKSSGEQNSTISGGDNNNKNDKNGGTSGGKGTAGSLETQHTVDNQSPNCGKYKCKICGKSYKYKLRFISHLRSHFRKNTNKRNSMKNSLCLNELNKTSIVPPKLKGRKYQRCHKPVTTGTSNLICKFNKFQSRKPNTASNAPGEQNEQDAKQHNCPLCYGLFLSESNLRRHLVEDHAAKSCLSDNQSSKTTSPPKSGKEDTENDCKLVELRPLFKCPKCGKNFKWKYSMQRHFVHFHGKNHTVGEPVVDTVHSMAKDTSISMKTTAAEWDTESRNTSLLDNCIEGPKHEPRERHIKPHRNRRKSNTILDLSDSDSPVEELARQARYGCRRMSSVQLDEKKTIGNEDKHQCPMCMLYFTKNSIDAHVSHCLPESESDRENSFSSSDKSNSSGVPGRSQETKKIRNKKQNKRNLPETSTAVSTPTKANDSNLYSDSDTVDYSTSMGLNDTEIDREIDPSMNKYSCPVCKEFFTKNSIDCHVSECLEKYGGSTEMSSDGSRTPARKRVSTKRFRPRKLLDKEKWCDRDESTSSVESGHENSADSKGVGARYQRIECPICEKKITRNSSFLHITECQQKIRVNNMETSEDSASENSDSSSRRKVVRKKKSRSRPKRRACSLTGRCASSDAGTQDRGYHYRKTLVEGNRGILGYSEDETNSDGSHTAIESGSITESYTEETHLDQELDSEPELHNITHESDNDKSKVEVKDIESGIDAVRNIPSICDESKPLTKISCCANQPSKSVGSAEYTKKVQPSSLDFTCPICNCGITLDMVSEHMASCVQNSASGKSQSFAPPSDIVSRNIHNALSHEKSSVFTPLKQCPVIAKSTGHPSSGLLRSHSCDESPSLARQLQCPKCGISLLDEDIAGHISQCVKISGSWFNISMSYQYRNRIV